MATTTTKLIPILGLTTAIFFMNLTTLNAKELDFSEVTIGIQKGNESFKYGQYVYVTLKDGSQTVGKIVGKKSPKKYYVNQLNGSNRGLVHVRYIRKMTEQEIKNYKADRKIG